MLGEFYLTGQIFYLGRCGGAVIILELVHYCAGDCCSTVVVVVVLGKEINKVQAQGADLVWSA
jgi:hypothetical protein